MKLRRFFILCSALALLGAPFAPAQDAPGKKKLAITKIAATDALGKRMSHQGVGLSLDSVLEALDSQVYDRVLNTKRFEILERSDADALAKESAAAGEAFGPQRRAVGRGALVAESSPDPLARSGRNFGGALFG